MTFADRLEELRRDWAGTSDATYSHFLMLHADAILELVRAAHSLEYRMGELNDKLNDAFAYLNVHNYGWEAADNWGHELVAVRQALAKLNGEQT